MKNVYVLMSRPYRYGPISTEVPVRFDVSKHPREVVLLEFRGYDSQAQTAVTQPANSTKPVPR